MRSFLTAAFFFFVAMGATLSLAVAQSGFDRPGGDYTYVQIRSGDPAACAAACERDPKCRAWSFSYPITARTAAICWLKSEVTPRLPAVCCVSGVRGTGVIEPRLGAVEFSIDRSGGDYRSLDLPPTVSPAACQATCEGDGRCRAWTYLRPGYGGPTARCYLKDRITAPRPKPCCISGVVR
jgi:hypothetical protein